MAVSTRSMSVATQRPITIGARRASVSCKAAPGQQFSMAMTAAACAGYLLTASPAMASVSFNVEDKAQVSSPVHLEFSVSGKTIKPASEGLQPGTGHFHVLIDQGAWPEGEPIPFDETHLHYGKAQTAADVALAPGKHTLTLQFADALHRSYGPAEATTIAVEVK